jgi:single-strand DNA-binding protein
MNKAILIGNVGKEPEIRKTQSGISVANFSLATSKKIKGEDKTEWHRIVAWDKLAEIIEKYVHKGDKLMIEGEIETRDYENDGQKVYTTEIRAWNMEMLGGKPEGNRNEAVSNQKVNVSNLDDIDDDLPF